MLAVGLIAAALLAFTGLAGEVMEGDTHAFDTRLLLALRSAADPANPLGPPWVQEMVRDFTALGSTGVLVIVTLTTVGYLALTGKRKTAILTAASIITGAMLSSSLKWGFARPRPDLVPHGPFVYTASFPSGHAMLSAVVYLTLAALLARVQPERAVKVFLIIVAALLTIIVGISRIYLGVHWPTDVLAGWVMGSCWAMLCWTVMLWLQRRGQVEPEVTTAT